MKQVLQNDMKNLELQQKQIIMMGGLVDKKEKKLSIEEIKKLENDYTWMYFGFVSINWGQGKTLGVSWQKGLEQMDAFIATKTKQVGHPVNDELVKIHARFRKEMAETIMTNPNVDAKLDERLKKVFFEMGVKDLKTHKDALEDTYKRFAPEQSITKPDVAKKFDIANQKTQKLLQILSSQQTHQYAA